MAHIVHDGSKMFKIFYKQAALNLLTGLKMGICQVRDLSTRPCVQKGIKLSSVTKATRSYFSSVVHNI